MPRSSVAAAALGLLVALNGGTAGAQAVPPNGLQADLGLAVVGLAYERTLCKYVALEFEGHLFSTWFGPYFGFPNFTGVGAQFRASLFPWGRAPQGPYVAIYERLDDVTPTASSSSAFGWGASVGAVVGYSAMVGRHFNVRFGAGVQYMDYTVDAANTRYSMTTPFPTLDLIVGWQL